MKEQVSSKFTNGSAAKQRPEKSAMCTRTHVECPRNSMKWVTVGVYHCIKVNNEPNFQRFQKGLHMIEEAVQKGGESGRKREDAQREKTALFFVESSFVICNNKKRRLYTPCCPRNGFGKDPPPNHLQLLQPVTHICTHIF